MKRRAITIILASVLLSACAGKVATTPNTGNANLIANAKNFGAVLAIALDKGIALEVTLASNGTIDPAIEPKIRQGLAQAKIATVSFNSRIATYTTFDATSKADIAKFLDDAIAFIGELNTNGILHLKSAQSQNIAAGILLGASTAVDLFRLEFTRAQ